MLTEEAGLRIKAIDAQIKALGEEREEIMREAAVRELPPGTYKSGKVEVEVSINKRFDSSLAMECYPLGENGENLHLYDATISSAKAKKYLSPADYEKLQKVYPNPRVEVRISE